MWRLTWAQMRRNVGKLIAVGIAIALGTGFITATFVTTNAVEQTALAAATAQTGDPDLVVSSSSYALDDASRDAIAAVDGVAASQAWTNTFREVATASGQEVLMLNPPAADDRLGNTTLLEGAAPSAPGEIALPTGTADRLGVEIGGSVDLVSTVWSADGSSSERVTEPVTVVGLLADGTGFGFGMPSGLADQADLTRWRAADGEASYSSSPSRSTTAPIPPPCATPSRR
ncbi:ABC transporter permease [Litorihabitans aurantiacus]|uniref:MacB-like periplasmic core domain-containing protein n=1 Tax=Litorihabitans aurantiacus TaxID=1930061 RepID=A0AA37XGM2_9MICO|nr:ABC transporter permease [Litorihabitans aurantiacus]GMA33060.1 hypothetical protein GCM10025875_30520 [Litorihabitans aurantiacus]